MEIAVARLDRRLALEAPAAWALVAVLAAALLVGRNHPLQNLNEGVYVRVAQEMLERHAFVVPVLDGVPYLEKPPLFYWITASGFAAFGETEAVARLASLLGAALAVAAAAWFARRHLAPRAAGFAAAIVATSPIVAVMSRTAMFDMLFTGLLFASLVLLHEALVEPERRTWLQLSYAALALAILAKGLAAPLFYALIAIAMIASLGKGERGAAARRFAEPGAVALLVAIAAPWHALAASERPGFAWFYFVNEHVMRFFDARVPHDYHTGPWWYYLPKIPAYVFPWALLLLLSAARSTLSQRERLARRFLWLALLVPLAVYSASGGKGEYYMIVGVPPLAVLAADRLARARAPRAVLLAIAASWVAVVAALALVPPSAFAPYVAPPRGPALLAIAAVLAAAATAAAVRGYSGALVLACTAMAIPCAQLYSDFLRANEPAKSSRTLARELNRDSQPSYLYREFESVSALPFYLDAPVGVVDCASGDLWYGLALDPRPDRFPDAATMQRRALSEPLWLVVPKSQRQRFEASTVVPAFVVDRDVGPLRVYASRPLAQRLARERSLAVSPR